MNKITNKDVLKLVTLCILIIVPFLKFFSMNLEMFGGINNYDNINPAIILYVANPFLIFIYIKDIINKKRKLDIYDYLFYILIITGIISVIFSIDKNLAIFGKMYRHEGFLSVLSYYLLFINWKINGSKDDIKKFIKLLVIISIINSIYAMLQIYAPFDFILKFEQDKKMASGLCGNPNFLGSLIVTAISIIMCNFLINKKITFRDTILIILFFIALINAQSTGPLLTFVLVILFLIVILKIKKKLVLKNLIVLIGIILLTYSSVYYVNKVIYKSNRCETCVKEVKKTVKTGGTNRFKIWKNSIEMVKEHPVVGIGFDNFHLAYPNPKVDNTVSFNVSGDKLQRKNPKKVKIYDNAHNVYLHMAITNGILGLIAYLLVCLLTFIKGLKFKSKLGLLLLSGFVAYSIQAFANISVIQVAPIYYIIIGLMLSIKEEPNKTSNI